MKALSLTLALIITLLFINQAFAMVEEYRKPRINGLRLDACLIWGKQCKKKAANKWCENAGNEKSSHWELDKGIGASQPTITFEGKEICSEPKCDAFKVIVCYSEK